MSIKILLQILKSRWLSFAIVFVLVFAAAAAYTFTRPKAYTATASLVADVKSDPIAGTVFANMASPSFLLTQVDIIMSTRVAARVVSTLRLTEIAELRQQWIADTGGTGDFPAWLGDRLRSGLDVRPSRGSNVINVYYSGSDPNFVSTVANAFVKAYLETTVELKTIPAKEYSRFFDANAKSMRDNLEAAQAKLSAFQQKANLVVTDERLDIETQRLNELNNQLVGVQSAAADSQSRQVQAQTQGDRMTEVMNSPLVTSLRGDLARQEGQLQQLGGRLGDNHPQVRELKLGIADMKTKLEGEVRRAQSSLGVNNQVNQSRVAQARVSLDEQRARVMKMKAVRDEAAVLTRDVENAQRAYDGVLSRLNMTNLESQNVQSNVASLEQATAPNHPSSPRIGLNLMLGALAAFVAGVVVVWFREARDQRVRSLADFDALLGQPMIGLVPSFKKRRFRVGLPQRALLGSSPGKSVAV